MTDSNSTGSDSTGSDSQDPSLDDGTVPDDADLKPVDEGADDPNDGEPDPAGLSDDEKDRELRHD